MSKPKKKLLDLNVALLQPGKSGDASATVPPPRAEMPILLTLDELAPNPDNPRTSRNPKFDDIKSSIRARGLDTVPKVTRDAERDARYIFSDGGNTRYQILRELWEETGDKKYFHIQCIFKPWPGRLACVIGHLAENEVRGDLSFIEKALGIRQARNIYEEQLGRRVTLRGFSELLGEQGYPIHYSNISRMEDTVKYLFPFLATMLGSGMGRPQIQSLLALRANALKTWEAFNPDNTETRFDGVFGTVCRQMDDPEIYTLDMFRDELIGALIEAMPHPALNYDRWLLELDPKEQARRLHFGEPEPEVFVAEEEDIARPPAKKTPARGPDRPAAKALRAPGNENPDEKPEYHAGHEAKTVSAPQVESPDRYSTLTERESGSEPGDNEAAFIWDILPLQDDIEHLQIQTYRLAFEIASHTACDTDITPDKASLHTVGFSSARTTFHPVSSLLASLTGEDPRYPLDPNTLISTLTGTDSANDAPLLDDAQTRNLFRLIRLIRRLRELQRALLPARTSQEAP